MSAAAAAAAVEEREEGREREWRWRIGERSWKSSDGGGTVEAGPKLLLLRVAAKECRGSG